MLMIDEEEIDKMKKEIDDEMNSGEVGHDDDHINPGPQNNGEDDGE